LYVTTQLLAVDSKRMRVFHRLHRGRDDALAATGEFMYLHVDTEAGKTVPMAGLVLERLATIGSAHAKLPWPDDAGRSVGPQAA
jgi:carnitine 3-dehydrogenase / betainyl-CoA thioesterase